MSLDFYIVLLAIIFFAAGSALICVVSYNLKKEINAVFEDLRKSVSQLREQEEETND